jgi:putative Holliday junction resolvase
MKYIGIDYGTKKTGVAVSDESGTIAFPRQVLPTDKFLPSLVADLIAQESISDVVVGESRSLSGGLNSVAEDTKDFVQALTKIVVADVEVHYEDERFTTKQARALPQEGSTRGNVANKRSGGSSKQADAQAAALILQTFLDKRKNLS